MFQVRQVGIIFKANLLEIGDIREDAIGAGQLGRGMEGG